jgi:hypothetical protein
MINPHRGDVPVMLGGRALSLRLTLGGLAALEHALGAPDLSALAERFTEGRIAARDLIAILRIGLAGAGHEVSEDEISRAALAGGLAPLVAAVAAMFAAAFAPGESGSTSPP